MSAPDAGGAKDATDDVPYNRCQFYEYADQAPQVGAEGGRIWWARGQNMWWLIAKRRRVRASIVASTRTNTWSIWWMPLP